MLSERVEVLEARLHNLRGMLLTVATPVATRAHAERLRKRGEELIEQAERVEAQLVEWTKQEGELKAEKRVVEMELELVQSCIRSGLQPSLAQIRAVLVQVIKSKGE